MSLDTVKAAVQWLRDGELLGKHLEVLWHAGEPLLAGLPFYRDAHAIILDELPSDTTWEFVFQTNGTLINDEWASFFASVRAQIGVSIDGPRDWHDRRRRTWGGKGSFDKVMAGIEHLRRRNVPFSTVSVLSREALEDPSQLYAFLRELGAESFGFNDEEEEGAHLISLQYRSQSARPRAERFYAGLYDLAARDGSYDQIREISKSLRAIHHLARLRANACERPRIPSEVSDPFRILNVAFNGEFSTFAPELLGHQVADIGPFVFGNVHRDSLRDVLCSDKFRLALEKIAAGVNACRARCEYYDVCGGGSPSNKFFENRQLDSDRTTFCELSIMAPIDAVLSRLEDENGEERLQTPRAFEAKELPLP
jgi:uncharacterized protein